MSEVAVSDLEELDFDAFSPQSQMSFGRHTSLDFSNGTLSLRDVLCPMDNTSQSGEMVPAIYEALPFSLEDWRPETDSKDAPPVLCTQESLTERGILLPEKGIDKAEPYFEALSKQEKPRRFSFHSLEHSVAQPDILFSSTSKHRRSRFHCELGRKRPRKSADSAKSRGRKPGVFTTLLKQFTPTDRPSAWKKESIRTKLLRSFKSYIRDLCKLDDGVLDAESLTNSSLPHHSKIRLKLHHADSKEALRLRKNIVDVYFEEKSLFYQMSNTGPKNDDKRNGLRHKLSDCNTYNDSYCQQYLQDERVRLALEHYIELVFCGTSLDSLCERFKSSCCSGRHTSRCQEKWAEFQEALLHEEFFITLT